MGYNIQTGTTFEDAKSIQNAKTTYTTGESGQDILVEASTSNSDDVVVIDLYYTEYDGPVTVNHIFVNENNNVVSSDKQTLPSESYIKKINVPITLTRNHTTAQTYEYVGYEELKGQYAKSSITGNRTLTASGTSVTINSNIGSSGKTINFYYKIRYDTLVAIRYINKSNNNVVLKMSDINKSTLNGKIKVGNTNIAGAFYSETATEVNYITDRFSGIYSDQVIQKEVETEITLKYGTKLKYEGYKVTEVTGNTINSGIFSVMGSVPYETELANGAINYGPSKFKADNIIIIDIYYTKDLEKISEPVRNITGKVFIEKLTLEMPQGSCNDSGTGISITSIPSGTRTKVGIESITKNIIASINKRRIYKTNDITLTVNKDKTYTFKYNVGYDVITDMAVYRLQDTWVSTEGLFNTSTHHDSYNTKPSVNRDNNNIKVYVIDGIDEKEIQTSGKIALDGIKNPNNLKIKLVVQNTQVEIDSQNVTNSGKKEATYTLTNNVLYKLETDEIVINKNLYKDGFGLVTKEEYNNSYLIDTKKENGVRILTGEAKYKYEQIIGNTNKDNMYEKGKTFDASTTGFTQNYTINNSVTSVQEKYAKVAPINIYTPITVSAEFTTSDVENLFNQSEIVVNNSVQENTQVIQANTPFTIKFGNKGTPSGYGLITDTIRYSMKYYIKFDFDVHDVYINGKLFKKGERVSSGEWIEVAKNSKSDTTVTAQAYGSGIGAVSNKNNSYTVRALAYNATKTIEQRLITIDSLENLNANTELKELLRNICSIPSYVAEEKYSVAIINRIYDFRITDLTDLNWKNIFRKNSEGTTNTHTGTIYYTGTTKIQETSNRKINVVNRTSNEIGRNPLRTLPLGPYKHTDTTYIQAPKLGYRFSFDMKITGAPSEDKYVSIKTRFYYISKDGKTFLEEYNGSGEGIYLFYKTSNGKYVRIDETGGGYELKFTPNDGYRYITGTDKSTLATTQVSLGNLRSIILNFKMMTKTDSDTIYYGEYKLPNSTIAVKVDKNGKYDINSPLKEGYIGVIFEIKAYVGKVTVDGYERDMILSYNKNIQTGTINTSQWDYEGYLGYTSLGKEVPNNGLNMKLEKGTWKITDDIYNKIKGSVILYDIDDRAATDYE